MTSQDLHYDTYVTLSVGTKLTGNLEALLGGKVLLKPRRFPRDNACVIGWGMKGRSADARRFAQDEGLPYISVEDGFLRSVQLGNVDPPLSIVWDDEGIYYAAGQPCRLERLISRAHTADERRRAATLTQAWREADISKYNHSGNLPLDVAGEYVLVVDQTAADASISHGLASAASFSAMLEAALDENPRARVLLKVHPDVIAGRKRAHFTELTPGAAARVDLLAREAHAPSLIRHAKSVYVVTSQMGFEALLWGRPVRTFGMPFYAGWGLTQDTLSAPARRHGASAVTLDDLAHAALVEYPRYVDPETLNRCEPERLVAWMALQRRMRTRFPPRLQALGFSRWKQPAARAFFSGTELEFVGDNVPRRPEVPAIVWGTTHDEQDKALGDAGVIRVEDGFLRSVGLGAHHVQPLSWVVDRTGMYYDATRPSDLEQLLQGLQIDTPSRGRASALREAIVRGRVTKYNVGEGSWDRPTSASTVVLVLGQVESDASIALGAPGSSTNLALLQATRALRPDAYILYKPHPDVLAGKRDASSADDDSTLYDERIADIPIFALFDQVDEVHVMTSLGGFEALLRGLSVVCHGCPFYAGWGLTEDRIALPRRTRRLTLDDLVWGALIAYPAYVSRATGAFTTPERVLYELTHWEEVSPPQVNRWRRALQVLAKVRDRWRIR